MVRTISSLLLVFAAMAIVRAQTTTFEGFKSINGTRLFVTIIGKGEPLLIVHGGPGLNQSYFHPHLDELAKKYKLIFYDQRASGKSAISGSDSLSLSYFVNDIEALRKDIGVEKINLFAHSWGAIPATAYGLAFPDRVQSIIYCNPVPLSKAFDQEMLTAQQSKMTSEDSTSRSMVMGSPDFKSGKVSAYQRLLLISFYHSFSDHEHFSELKLELPANYVQASKALYTGLSKELTQYNYYPQLSVFSFPVLILHGANDAIPLAASTQLKNSLSHSSLEEFSKSGHFIFIEESKKFSKEVSDFLNKY